MELSPAETKLINFLRMVDIKNPLGIDNYTEDRIIEICLLAIGWAPAEAERRFQLFLKQSKQQPLIDLKEAQRYKEEYEDMRLSEDDKIRYEQNYKRLGRPAPKWETRAT